MYSSLFHGTVQYAVAFWVMIICISLCLFILFLVIRVHFKKTALPQDYLYFQKYLQGTISTIEDIDVSAERKIAEVSGFMDDI